MTTRGRIEENGSLNTPNADVLKVPDGNFLLRTTSHEACLPCSKNIALLQVNRIHAIGTISQTTPYIAVVY